MRRETRNNSPRTTAFGLYHTGALNNCGKMKICKKHQAFEKTRSSHQEKDLEASLNLHKTAKHLLTLVIRTLTLRREL